MKVLSELTVKDYRERFKESLDSRFAFGSERFTGWMIGRFFSLSYFSGHEFLRRNYPICNKAMGFVRERDGKAEILFLTFKGITDPVSFLLLYLGCLVIFAAAKIPLSIGWWLSLLWYAAVAALTFLFTALSERGKEGDQKLKVFAEHPGRTY